MKKVYARLNLTEPDFQLVRSAVISSRDKVFSKWVDSSSPDEKAFYEGLVDNFDRILTTFSTAPQNDRSQGHED
jgi:hypothetical protein